MNRRSVLKSLTLGSAAAYPVMVIAAPNPIKITCIRFYHNPASPLALFDGVLRAALADSSNALVGLNGRGRPDRSTRET